MADHTFKVILVGQSGVGKTAIVRRYIRKRFVDKEQPTIGVDIGVKLVEIDGVKVKLKIWDSAGSERFRSLTTSYYRNADAAILVYGIDDVESFYELESWYQELTNQEEGILKVLVGNKNDIEAEDGRAVSQDMAVNFSVLQDIDLAIECSAKLDDNIRYIFHSVANKLLEKLKRRGLERVESVVENVPNHIDNVKLRDISAEKKKCC